MSASAKVDLAFAYTRHDDGRFTGRLSMEGAAVAADIFTHEEWVRFVVTTIQRFPKTPVVSFALSREGAASRMHTLDARTVEQIRSQSLTAEVLTL